VIRHQIADIVRKALAALQEAGELPAVDLPAVEVERPQIEAHGDYATAVALKLAPAVAKATGQKANPRGLAEKIASRLQETIEVVPAYEMISTVEVAGPGFINFRLDKKWLLAQAAEVIAVGNSFGSIRLGEGKRINLEFVSANPTGPVTVGNGRGAFIGDTLGNVLRAAGYDVTKEYYFNDGGSQILKLGRSMEYYLWLALGDTARAEGLYASLPEAKDEKKSPRGPQGNVTQPEEAEERDEAHDDAEQQEQSTGRKSGYFGPYYETVAQRMRAADGRTLLELPEDERPAAIGKAAAAAIMDDIRETMAKMHVEFDVWFNEASLVTSGARAQGIEWLRDNGFTEEREGALWAKTSQFGDTQDWVIRRSNGEPTYLASDVAYVRNKLDRGFDRLIYVLGADHHSYIGRLKALAQMFGRQPDDVHVVLYQAVLLVVDGKPMRMGKRLGNVVTLDELYDDIGPDVTRFFYLMRSHDTRLDFDLGLARQQGDENPVFSVQYAHARTAGVFRKATEQGITEEDYGDAKLGVLANDPEDELQYELALMRQLLRLEEVVERIAVTLEPHHLARYAMDLADAFHLFYDRCPILKEGTDIPREMRFARLRLMRAAQAGLARTLALLGMSAPERMERTEGAEAAGAAKE
jgi:arginyl-tRNA synthetase